MATIVLGMATSHTPQLAIQPDRWRAAGENAKRQPRHWFAGKIYSYDELLEVRSGEHLEKELTDDKLQTRWNACQESIAHLAQTLDRVAPDVCVIIGDDQEESFNDAFMPPFAIFHGSSLDDVNPEGSFPDTDPAVLNGPKACTTHPTDARLAEHLIECLTEQDFDVARTNQLTTRRNGRVTLDPTFHNTAGHAFHFVYRRLMNNEVIPNVPIMVNTFYPPNVPRAARAFKFGQAVRRAVESWDSPQRVAVIASGGLSHTVIEEDFDHRIIEGLESDDFVKLTDWPDVRFRAGTSEIKNWIALAGAMSGTGLRAKIDYVPAYRSPAGNGVGMGFGEWV